MHGVTLATHPAYNNLKDVYNVTLDRVSTLANDYVIHGTIPPPFSSGAVSARS